MDDRYLLVGPVSLAFCVGCYALWVTHQLHETGWIWPRLFDFVGVDTITESVVIGVFGLSFLALLEMIFGPSAVVIIFIALLMVGVASIVYQLEVHRAERKRETQIALNQLVQLLAGPRRAYLDQSIARGLNAALQEMAGTTKSTDSITI